MMSRKDIKSKQTDTESIRLSSVALDDSRSVRADKTGKTIAYFCRRKPVKVDRYLVEELKQRSVDLGNKNVRLCLHEDSSATFHNMIILEREGNYYRAHKHLTKGEVFHIIEGRMAVFAFNDQGMILDRVILSSEGNFIYQVGINMYHAVMPLSDLVIYHEAKPGPFLGDKDSVYPSWAPVGDNARQVRHYQEKLRLSLDKGIF